MKLYVAKKSGWGAVSFLSILACILIIPIIILILRIIAYKKETIVFYEDKIVYEKGWINKKKRTFAFTGVFSVDVDRTLTGRIFNYGHLAIDFVGKTDISTRFIKDPVKLEEFLNSKIVNRSQVQTHVF